METKGRNNLEVDLTKRTIVMTRVFDAPRALVFKVVMDPKLVPQWWGPRRYTTRVDTMDLKPGGAWRYVQQGADGQEFGFHGVYREIVPPERVVYTFEFEGMPGHELLETITLEDLGGKTRVTACDVFPSVEDLQGMLNSGMEGGATESWDRLTELLLEAQAVPAR
jgi:uncharacterized protein YndB with AHSA1/START domain